MPAVFQSFNSSSSPAATAPRLAALRAELARQNLDGFVVPRADRYQNEYVPSSEKRLSWLTGFTGSAGTAVVLADRAALFVDGRYTLQAAEQVDTTLFEIVHLVDQPVAQWVAKNLRSGARLGYDPWLHTAAGGEKLAAACEQAGGTLVPVDHNPIDGIWSGRPPAPLGAVVLHDPKYAGEGAVQKLARVRAELETARVDLLVVSDPHAVAWLFNIRGSDVAHTPLPLSMALVPRQDMPSLYVDDRKLAPAVQEALSGLCRVCAPDAFAADLAALATPDSVVRIDEATGAHAIARIVATAGGKVVRGPDPIALMRAIKNPTEIDGARAAHLRDGVALTRFLAWLDGAAANGAITEIDAVEALEDFRRATNLLKDVSFPTIAGAGPNGAIVHYKVTRKSNRHLAPGDLFLVDSGAQFLDGTTDVTRTIAIGVPTAEMRDRFTRVLKGHIAIARAVFPDGTTGAQLDSLARAPLWAAGIDFDHGTGHGVGSYLSVHEGPARISKLGTAPLQRGMIISNEPGYYKTGAFGIRIENLLLVIEAPPVEGAEFSLDAFETLTLAPIDRRLVEPALLFADEIAWLDGYHDRVRATLTPLLDEPTRAWLDEATRPLRTH